MLAEIWKTYLLCVKAKAASPVAFASEMIIN